MRAKLESFHIGSEVSIVWVVECKGEKLAEIEAWYLIPEYVIEYYRYEDGFRKWAMWNLPVPETLKEEGNA